MHSRLDLLALALAAWIGVAAISGCGDGCDADADADVDVDADGDADGDARSDAEVDVDGEPCGDGACMGGETARTCPADCPAVCGDGDCTHDEGQASCPRDCGSTDCDVIAGSGCGADERCGLYTPDGAGARWLAGCLPSSPETVAGAGEPCMRVTDERFGAFDNCVGGYWCIRRPTTGDFHCEKLCTYRDRAPCTAAYPDAEGNLTVNGLCVYETGTEMPVEDLMVCAIADGCSPTCQDCPEGGPGGAVGCYPASDGINHGAICARFGRADDAEGVTGDGCEGYNNCAPGYICLSSSGGGDECRAMCDATADTPAGDGDADADADAETDADADAGPPCPFSFCADRVGEDAGTCQVPRGFPPEMFGLGVRVGACLE